MGPRPVLRRVVLFASIARAGGPVLRWRVAQENGWISTSCFGTFVHCGYTPHCSFTIQPRVKQLADGQAFALRSVGAGVFCTQQNTAAQKYSPCGHPQWWGLAIIAYTVEDYRPPRAEFCTKTYVTACKMWNSKIDPVNNTTRWVCDDLNRATDEINGSASRCGTATPVQGATRGCRRGRGPAPARQDTTGGPAPGRASRGPSVSIRPTRCPCP